jgi:coenzyme F420-0:L-glutamate ligase/coenzyme F420-1:gamma-L-glutamate ligase
MSISPPNEFRVVGLMGMPEIAPGDDLASAILAAAAAQDIALRQGDVVVVAQKIVSKAEGRLVSLDTVVPSDFATRIARRARKDARHVEIVLREARRIVRMDRNVIIAETHHGFVCANAGVDESNVAGGGVVSLLPADPDRSAAKLRAELARRTGAAVGVVVSDTFGRPWRDGLVNVAIGVAGLAPIVDYRGKADAMGYRLKATAIAIADELACAAELVMGKTAGIPAAIIRGYTYPQAEGNARQLIRPKGKDLFR